MTPEQLAASGSESAHQKALFTWQAIEMPELRYRLFAVPNGFYSSAAQKAKMKAEGLKPGTWDIFLSWPARRNNRHEHCAGLFIEMKHERYRNHKDGGLTSEQIAFRYDLHNEYAFAIAYSWIEARDAILRYLGRV